MFKNLYLTVAIFWLTPLITGCATNNSGGGAELKRKGLPLYAEAIKLRGQTKEKVIEKLGDPADQPNPTRGYWFLSDESTYHPDPTPILYEFQFTEKGILESVKKGVQP